MILDTPREKWLNFANNGCTYQMLHSAVTDLDLHCFPITLLGSPDKSELICFASLQTNNNKQTMNFDKKLIRIGGKSSKL